MKNQKIKNKLKPILLRLLTWVDPNLSPKNVGAYPTDKYHILVIRTTKRFDSFQDLSHEKVLREEMLRDIKNELSKIESLKPKVNQLPKVHRYVDEFHAEMEIKILMPNGIS